MGKQKFWTYIPVKMVTRKLFFGVSPSSVLILALPAPQLPLLLVTSWKLWALALVGCGALAWAQVGEENVVMLTVDSTALCLQPLEHCCAGWSGVQTSNTDRS